MATMSTAIEANRSTLLQNMLACTLSCFGLGIIAGFWIVENDFVQVVWCSLVAIGMFALAYYRIKSVCFPQPVEIPTPPRSRAERAADEDRLTRYSKG